MDDEFNPRNSAVLSENLDAMTFISSVSSLSTDVLLEIFQINAYMDGDPTSHPFRKDPTTQDKNRAINTTRLSSQVSSLWRSLITNAPILWANLIDVDFLNSTNDLWREEVIRRTQNSPLYVKGSISLNKLDISEPWWLNFLDHNWPRIRKLNLDVLCKVRQTTSLRLPNVVKYRNGLSFLSRSTSALRSFRMKLETQWDPLEAGSLLFDNHAPQLRFFQIENVQFSTKYSWLSQLRNLHIYQHDGNILTSVDVLYEVLSRMHHLEALYLEDTDCSPYIAPNRIPIHFPQLKSIRFRSAMVSDVFMDLDGSNVSTWWILLNHIIPEAGCSIQLILELPSSGEIDTNILSRLARNYFQVHRPMYLEIATHTDYFTLSDTRDLTWHQRRDELIPETPFFNLIFDFHTARNLPSTDQRIYRLFKELLFLSFPAVVELHLTVFIAHATVFTDPQFGRFLSSFTALEKISTVPHTLQRLSTSPVVNISTLFPLLDVLEITVDDSVLSEAPMSDPLPQILVSFLQPREEAGVPVSTFEYRCTSDPDGRPPVDDLTSLDTFTGLKVVWDFQSRERGQYTCGSGLPEELNFKNKPGTGRP